MSCFNRKIHNGELFAMECILRFTIYFVIVKRDRTQKNLQVSISSCGFSLSSHVHCSLVLFKIQRFKKPYVLGNTNILVPNRNL